MGKEKMSSSRGFGGGFKPEVKEEAAKDARQTFQGKRNPVKDSFGTDSDFDGGVLSDRIWRAKGGKGAKIEKDKMSSSRGFGDGFKPVDDKGADNLVDSPDEYGTDKKNKRESKPDWFTAI